MIFQKTVFGTISNQKFCSKITDNIEICRQRSFCSQFQVTVIFENNGRLE